MKVFVDANILVSVLNKEYPLFIYSSRVLSLAGNKKFQLFTSPTCLAIAHYFAEKKSGSAEAKRKLQLLASKLEITPTDKSTVMNIFQNKAINDFEDGLEYYSALRSKCKCIVTEDRNDFHFSVIEVLDAKSFLERWVLK